MEKWESPAIGAGLFLLGRLMGDILTTANAYSQLLDIEYQIILGKKNKTIELTIGFEQANFFHLAGLQYLEDMPDILRSRRDILFSKIIDGTISVQQIESSAFYSVIKERIDYLAFLESIIDSNKTIFKYNSKLEVFSSIVAEFLLKNEIQARNIFTFLSQDKQSGKYFCRSFFPQIDKDYSEGQTTWTLLYKKKIYKSKNQEIVLYDKLNK